MTRFLFNRTNPFHMTLIPVLLICLIPTVLQAQSPFQAPPHYSEPPKNLSHDHFSRQASQTFPSSQNPVRTPNLRSGSSINLNSNPYRTTSPPFANESGFSTEPSHSFVEQNNPIPQRKNTFVDEQVPARINQKSLTGIAPKLPVTEDEIVKEIIDQGLVFEQNQQWKEALILYENAVRSHKNNPALMERFRIVRFHYDIERRYEDKSFENLLQTMSFLDTLALYDDVMFKIQMNHVDSPHWNEMLHYGLCDFEIAMQTDAFRAKNQITISKEEVHKYFQQLHQVCATWNIDSVLVLRNQILRLVEFFNKECAINPTTTLFEFLCGIANSLDPYTAFLTLNQYNDQMCIIRGNFAGLGIEFTSDGQSPIITRVILGSPAQKAGLKKNDRILSIDGVSTQNLTIDQSANLLQGNINSIASLQILSENASLTRDVHIKREQVKVLSVEDTRILNEYTGDYQVGYIRLTGFQQDTVLELQSALENLYHQGMQYLILDLRHNPGGVLTEAIAAADLFIKSGIIVRTRSRSDYAKVEESIHSATPQRATWDVPLIVLIDEESASASEIFAGAIRDHRRGIIIGKKSYGKDTVQAVYALCCNTTQETIAGLKLTTQTFLSPKGIPYAGVGVEPDVVTDDPDKHIVAYANPNMAEIPPLSEDHTIRVAIEEIERNLSSASRSIGNRN